MLGRNLTRTKPGHIPCEGRAGVVAVREGWSQFSQSAHPPASQLGVQVAVAVGEECCWGSPTSFLYWHAEQRQLPVSGKGWQMGKPRSR